MTNTSLAGFSNRNIWRSWPNLISKQALKAVKLKKLTSLTIADLKDLTTKLDTRRLITFEFIKEIKRLYIGTSFSNNNIIIYLINYGNQKSPSINKLNSFSYSQKVWLLYYIAPINKLCYKPYIHNRKKKKNIPKTTFFLIYLKVSFTLTILYYQSWIITLWV